MRRDLRVLLAGVVATAAAVLVAAAPAVADPAEDEAAHRAGSAAGGAAVGEIICAEYAPLIDSDEDKLAQCEGAIADAVTYEMVENGDDAGFCADLASEVADYNPRAIEAACSGVAFADIESGYMGAYEEAVASAPPPDPTDDPSRDGEEAPGQFNPDPDSEFDSWLNDMFAGGTDLFDTAIGYAVDSTSFRGDAGWWRGAFAANAGVGLVVLSIMLLMLYRQASSGKISGEELGRSFTIYLPTYVALTVFGPAMGYVLGNISSELSRVMLEWTGGTLEEMMDLSTIFGVMTVVNTPGGALVGLILVIAMAIGALSLFVTLILINISTYVLGAVTAIAVAMFVHPRWRRKAMAVPMGVLGLLLAKPALFLILGLVSMLLSDQISQIKDELANPVGAILNPVDTLIAAFTLCLAVLVVGLSPIGMLKWMPLLPDGADVGSPNAGGMTSDLLSSGASAAQRGLSSARNGSRTSGGGGLSTRSNSSGGSGGPSPGRSASPSAPGTRPAAGGAGQAAAGGGGQQAAKMGGAAASSGGKAAATAGKAVAGVGTAGAAFAAHVGLSAAKGAVDRGKRLADSAAPQLREYEDRDF